jgi:hypothetical protein
MYTKIVFQRINFHLPNFLLLLPSQHNGGLAQLARALAWHARGHRFDSDILHPKPSDFLEAFFMPYSIREPNFTGV